MIVRQVAAAVFEGIAVAILFYVTSGPVIGAVGRDLPSTRAAAYRRTTSRMRVALTAAAFVIGALGLFLVQRVSPR